MNFAKENKDDLATEVANFQWLFHMKIYAGKIFEAWDGVKKNYQASGLSQTYQLSLHQDGREALKRLNKTFSKPTLLHQIRNKSAFHYDNEILESAANKRSLTGDFVTYQENLQINCFFSSAEELVTRATLEKIGRADEEHTLRELYDEILDATTDLNTFGMALFVTIMQKHCPDRFQQENLETVYTSHADSVGSMNFFLSREAIDKALRDTGS